MKAFIICGSPGAGKSTYAKRLSKERGASFLCIDTTTERLVRAGLQLACKDPDDRDSPLFKETFRQPIYKTLFDIARENLQWQDVVIEGPFTREIRNPNWLSELGKDLKCLVEVHYIYCPPEIRKDRLLRRGNPRDRMKLNDWQKYIQYYGSEEPPVFPHVYIDTSI